MPSYRLRFHFKRTVTCFVEYEDESDIDNFMNENPAFNPTEDFPEMIEEDETGYDEECELGDYEIVEDDNVVAAFVITPGLQLREIDE